MKPLIKDVLKIPFKDHDHDDRFRFLCPMCKEFMTGINPNTNLARCFLCEKNFNPIDLVMTVKQYNFLNTVELVESLFNIHEILASILSQLNFDVEPMYHKTHRYLEMICEQKKV